MWNWILPSKSAMKSRTQISQKALRQVLRQQRQETQEQRKEADLLWKQERLTIRQEFWQYGKSCYEPKRSPEVERSVRDRSSQEYDSNFCATASYPSYLCRTASQLVATGLFGYNDSLVLSRLRSRNGSVARYDQPTSPRRPFHPHHNFWHPARGLAGH